MSLREYNRKRKFAETPEPRGQKTKAQRGPLRFVVQLHRATRLHFDFRLEFGGVFKSWAVPKGPSLNPQDQRLAVFVEDHPLDYGSFEGIIPKGNYGAGTVLLWDQGSYLERGSETRAESEDAMLKGFEKGHMTFVLTGEKLNGEFALIKLKKDEGERAWLLVKKRDEHSSIKRTSPFTNLSVKTGRTLEEITAQSAKDGSIWQPSALKPRLAAAKVSPPPKKPVRARASTKDLIPRKNKPMLATAAREVSVEADWLFDLHPPGLRAIAEVEGRRIHLYSRSGISFDKKYPQILEALKKLDGQMVVDGIITKLPRGHEFQFLDLLYLAGKDLRNERLQVRRDLLLGLSLTFPLAPIKALTLANRTKNPNASVVAKNLDSFYRAGTSADWRNLPNDFALTRPAAVLPTLKKKPPPRMPTLESTLKPISAPIATSSEEPRLTNLEKIYWPKEGHTKGDLLNYYKDISKYILPYLIDRPESLNRQPNGIGAPGFYQKDMTGHIPRWLKTERIYSESTDKSIDYVVVQDERSLLYIVNLGCIEIHPWFSRLGHLSHPDFLVIDLDPDENDFDHVMEVALRFHEILEQIGAANFCKTSGATGIHIGVPLAARYEFEAARAFAEALCRIVVKEYPATTSVDRNPNRRRKKIYLDFLQNRRGQTLAAPFCLRPREGAPVSMPLFWKDLRPGLRPHQFHIGNAREVIKKQKGAWEGVLGKAIDLKACQRRLQKAFKT